MWQAVIAALVLLVAVSHSHAAILESQVTDALTGQPVEGAVVLGRWTTDGRIVSESEVGTDAHGRFALDKPAGVFSPGDELVVIYKYGYVAWANSMIFHVDGPPRIGAGTPTPTMRQDLRVPPRIALDRFPTNGNHPAHVWWLNMLVAGDGQNAQRPKLWHAIQQESAEAARQMEDFCRNRRDCD